MILVSLDVAKRHVTETDPAKDAEVQMYLEYASAAIVDYIAERADPEWDETTAPPVVQYVTLKYLAHLYENRGDDADARRSGTEIWTDIAHDLKHLRDPGLA